MNELMWVKVAAILWVSQIQYFIVQVVVARSWPEGYSWPKNYISDLGNSDMSPLFAVMNVSFVVLGLTMAGGAALLAARLGVGLGAQIGFGLVGLGGIGTIVVGLFPENSISAVHVAGAALPFLVGNVGMLVLGLTLRVVPRWLQLFTAGSGVVTLVALALFFAHIYLGIGRGNMERLVSYPQTVWMIVFAVWLLRR